MDNNVAVPLICNFLINFSLGPDPLGTVVGGAPHAKVPYGSFLGLTQQAYKVALSVRLLLEIS